MPFRTAGFELASWQEEAVAAWQEGARTPETGTLEIFTGGGKTLMALECVARASEKAPDLQVAIVVPTVALAEQWVAAVERHLEWVSPHPGRAADSGQLLMPGLDEPDAEPSAQLANAQPRNVVGPRRGTLSRPTEIREARSIDRKPVSLVFPGQECLDLRIGRLRWVRVMIPWNAPVDEFLIRQWSRCGCHGR